MKYTRLVIVVVATAAALGYSLLAPRSSTDASQGASDATPDVALHRDRASVPELLDPPRRPEPDGHTVPTDPRRDPPLDIPRSDEAAAPGEAHGALPAGTTIFDDEIPGVAELDAALLGALRQAAAHAENQEEIELVINSGWRSPEYQDRLLQEAISKYGSEEEAARWVATPTTSVHVSGDAVDIGPLEATAWLAAHGAAYGLCQIYSNEPWHYELRPRAIDRGCPDMYADPTHDPRLD